MINRLMVLIALLLLGLFGGACGSTTELSVTATAPTSPSSTPVLTLTNTPFPINTPTPTSTPTPTATATPAPTSTPTSTSIPAVGTTQNPVPFGEWQRVVVQPGYVFEIRIIDQIRGDEAEKVINAGNDFLPEKPGAGKEFYSAYVEAKFLESPPGEPETAAITAWVGWSVAVDGRVYEAPSLIMLDGMLNAELLPEGVAEGWVPFIIPVGSKPTAIRFSEDLVQRGTWFAVQQGPSD